MNTATLNQSATRALKRCVALAVMGALAASWMGCDSRSSPPPPPTPAAEEQNPNPLPPVASMDEATLLQWAQRGQKLWQAKTCSLCHSLKGAPLVGPSPIGIWGTKQKLEGGREVVVDEAYIRESILDPAAAITQGFPNQMLSFRGMITDEELTALAALFRAVKDGPLASPQDPPPPPPAAPPR